MNTQPQQVSACLIVRDEAERISACLASIAPFVQQTVVLDTGSTDRTPELVVAAGAQLHRMTWSDDFAVARNAALAACTGAWVLSVDADEVVEGVPGWLPAMLAVCGPELDGLSVEIANASGPDARGLRTHREVKLLRRDRLRWAGRVHERPVRHDGTEARVAAMPAETLRLVHFGYSDPAVVLAKAARNVRLCELELRALQARSADPADVARAALDLGRSYLADDRADLALPVFRHAREAAVGSPVWCWATDYLIRLAWEQGRPDEATWLVAELSRAGAPAGYCRWLLALTLMLRDDFGGAAELLSMIGQLVDLSGNELDLTQVERARSACAQQLAS